MPGEGLGRQVWWTRHRGRRAANGRRGLRKQSGKGRGRESQQRRRAVAGVSLAPHHTRDGVPSPFQASPLGAMPPPWLGGQPSRKESRASQRAPQSSAIREGVPHCTKGHRAASRHVDPSGSSDLCSTKLSCPVQCGSHLEFLGRRLHLIVAAAAREPRRGAGAGREVTGPGRVPRDRGGDSRSRRCACRARAADSG